MGFDKIARDSCLAQTRTRVVILTAVVVLGVWAPIALAQREISAAEYLDRLRGMWFGQLIGNRTGRPFEGT